MTPGDKALYHQIHPAKLAADLAAAGLALAALWLHWLLPGFAAAAVIPAAASALVIRRADLERYRRSRAGAYVKKFMTRSATVRRLLGFAMMAAGAWFHASLAILIGASLIIHAWTAGMLVPRQAARV